jgi:hypothetical protein
VPRLKHEIQDHVVPKQNIMLGFHKLPIRALFRELGVLAPKKIAWMSQRYLAMLGMNYVFEG